MPTETVRANWLHDRVFRLTDHLGYPIRMTQPDGVAGADLLPLSLIGCALWDVQGILHKQRVGVTSLQATAECLRADGAPYNFQRIHIHYAVSGKDLTPAQVTRAINLSETKYCSTYATLAPAIAITSDFEILPASSVQPHARAAEGDAAAVVTAFVAAFNARDVDGLLSRLAPEAVLEYAVPPPVDFRCDGPAASRAFWEKLFAQIGAVHLEPEEVLAFGDHCVLRYAWAWRGVAGDPRLVAGVDVYRLRSGAIVEKFAYLKG
jgi:putative redox protein